MTDTESFREQLQRVEHMADPDQDLWDFSRQDVAALEAVLADRQRMAAKLNAQTELAVGTLQTALRQLEKLLRRYLDNHCGAADQEGMSTLCECPICRETRQALLPALEPTHEA